MIKIEFKSDGHYGDDLYEMTIWHPRFPPYNPLRYRTFYYHESFITQVLSSKMELLFCMKQSYASLAHTLEADKIILARLIWEHMSKPYNFKFEEFQEAWESRKE